MRFHSNEILELTRDDTHVRIFGGSIDKKLEKFDGIDYELVRKKQHSELLLICSNVNDLENKSNPNLISLFDKCYHYTKYNTYSQLVNDIDSNKLVSDYWESKIEYIESQTHTYKTYLDKGLVIGNKFISIKESSINILDLQINEVQFKGGIAIDSGNKWLEDFSSYSKNKCLIITNTICNFSNIDTLEYKKIDTYTQTTKYDRIILHLDNNVQYGDVFWNKVICLISDIKWIVVDAFPKNREVIIKYISFISGKQINNPVYSKLMDLNNILKDIVLVRSEIQKISSDEEVIKINRFKYELTNTEKSFLYKLNNKRKMTKYDDEYDMIDDLNMLFIKPIGSNKNNDPIYDCPICMEATINICKTQCKHSFCVSCIVRCIVDKPKCPLCRESIIMSNIEIYNNYESAKLSLIKSIIIDNDTKVIMYIKNILLIKELGKLENVYLCIGTKQDKINIIKKINEIKKCTVIIQSTDFNIAKDIHGVERIIITDYNYKYIINKEALGFDFYTNKKKIQLNIYEVNRGLV
jgi:hypothetical protein